MRSPKLLLYIIIAVIVIGVAMLALQWRIAGGIVTALGLALYFFWSRIQLILKISEALGKEDFEGAKAQMDKVKNPERLNDYSKTYYFFFRGIIDTKENRFREAREAFARSLEISRFRAPDEKATAHLMMAQLELRKRNRPGAQRHLQEAKALAQSKQLQDQVKEVTRQARLRN